MSTSVRIKKRKDLYQGIKIQIGNFKVSASDNDRQYQKFSFFSLAKLQNIRVNPTYFFTTSL